MKILRSIDKLIARVESWLIIATLSLMVFLTFIHIVLRALYTHAHIQWANAVLGQVDWTEPFVRLLVLWVTFLGASLLTSDDRHIKIDLMSSLLPPGLLPLRGMALSAGCVLISALMLKASIDYLRTEIAFGGNMFLGIPTWIGQLVLPAGFAMILFRFFLRAMQQALETVRGKRP
ncbi:MAG: TRAP transporter small permease subunit [Deltaproteobacteria bacterium]|nr:TRAP transporter small permease subunit [Deltaproteobacteria bacterium]